MVLKSTAVNEGGVAPRAIGWPTDIRHESNRSRWGDRDIGRKGQPASHSRVGTGRPTPRAPNCTNRSYCRESSNNNRPVAIDTDNRGNRMQGRYPYRPGGTES